MQRILGLDRSPEIGHRTETLLSRNPLGRGIRVTQQGPLRANSHSSSRDPSRSSKNPHRVIRAPSPSSGIHRVRSRIREYKPHSSSQRRLNSLLGVVSMDLVGQEAHNSLDHMVHDLTHEGHATLVVAWVT